MSEERAHVPAPPEANGLAIASLVLGIIALLTAPILFGALVGILALLLGIIHLRGNGSARRFAKVGMSLGGVAILIGTLIVAVLISQTSSLQETDYADWRGKAAPDFSIDTLDGKKLTLSELQGKRVIIDFWATWCPPCRKEIPHFVQLAQENPNDLVILGISNESPELLRQFAAEQGVNYHLASGNLSLAPYNLVTGIPTTFFLDEAGVIENVLVGYHGYSALKSAAIASVLTK